MERFAKLKALVYTKLADPDFLAEVIAGVVFVGLVAILEDYRRVRAENSAWCLDAELRELTR